VREKDIEIRLSQIHFLLKITSQLFAAIEPHPQTPLKG
jgi:hypothetical protein